MKLADRSGIISELFSRLLRSPLERERAFYRRYRDLSGVIDESPDDLAAYVLRGEMNLDRREHERAQADFESAVELAAVLDDDKGWNVMEQVMRDRALYGLGAARDALRAAR